MGLALDKEGRPLVSLCICISVVVGGAGGQGPLCLVGDLTFLSEVRGEMKELREKGG